jgi:hypothetical protein
MDDLLKRAGYVKITPSQINHAIELEPKYVEIASKIIPPSKDGGF